MPSSVQEELLIASAAKGDKAARRALIESHQRWAYPLAFRIWQDSQIAEKATVYAFVQTFKDLDPVPQKQTFAETLAARLVEFSRSQAKKGVKPAALTFEQELNLKVELPQARRALLGLVIAGLKHLSMEERMLLLLRDQAHFSCEAIADMTGRPRPMVRQRLSAIRMKLRKSMTRPLETNPKLTDHEV